MNFVAKILNLSRSATLKLEEKNILRRAFIKHKFFQDIIEAYRLDKKFGFYEEGTVVAKTSDGLRVVRGFPKIRRALTIDPTIKKHFKNKKIAVEEKMNGYNVRVVKFGENLYGITRRGLFCPYTTEKIREKIPADFFDDYPDYMLCVEAVGEASPYVPTTIYNIADLDFYLFDIRHSKTNEPLSIKEKEEIAASYELKIAPILAVVNPDETEIIKRVIEDLNSKNREGVVLKDVEMMIEPIKYTTSFANCLDLNYAFKYFNEYARDFMLARIVREAFQSFEFKDSDEEFDERCRRLGASILGSLVESIDSVNKGEIVAEKCRLIFSNPEIIELFKEHLKLQRINFRLKIIEKKGDQTVVLLERIMRGTTDKISSILNGALWR